MILHGYGTYLDPLDELFSSCVLFAAFGGSETGSAFSFWHNI